MLSNEGLEAAIEKATAPRVTPQRIDEVIADKAFHRLTGTLTVCVLTLANGFTVTGESACASPENYNQDIGEKIAFDNAREKIWLLEGYALKDRLAQAGAAVVPAGDGMTRYIGTKVLNAKPMSRADYNHLRGWQLPTDENGNDAGYLVEYTDEQRPNTPAFHGYVSWSPVDVFERAYRPI